MENLIDIYNKTKKIYEKYYDIHLCAVDEIDDVIDFIDQYWQKNHILTLSKELLDWQHYDRKNNRYNFVVARSRKTKEIHGIIGYILSSIYDSEITNPIRWGVVWKVREDVAIKGLGMVLKGYMETMVPVDYIGGVGLSKYSKELDKKLGEKMGKLSQYYIANPDVDEYMLIKNPQLDVYVNTSNNKRAKKILDPDQFVKESVKIEDKIMPYKSVKYYINRYFNHPLYNYNCIAIINMDECVESIFFYRKCGTHDANNIFIVDYIGWGEELSDTYHLFVELLRDEKAECISFPCYGISDQDLKKAGFKLREESDVVLPVYYEPFLRTNIDLDFHFWSRQGYNNEILVKGDADQDRPNKMPEVCDD